MAFSRETVESLVHCLLSTTHDVYIDSKAHNWGEPKRAPLRGKCTDRMRDICSLCVSSKCACAEFT